MPPIPSHLGFAAKHADGPMRLRCHHKRHGIFRRFGFRVLAFGQVLGLANLLGQL